MSSTALRGQECKIYKAHVIDIIKFFFYVRFVDVCNRSPERLLHCSTVTTFKRRLDCFMKDRGYQ